MTHTRFNIVDLFFDAARKYPDKTAIIEPDQQVSFATLAQQVQDTAAYFLDKGIGPGDRVLVFVPMSIHLYRTVLALFHIGATAVFLDEWVNKKRMEECCKVAQCKGFIGIPKARLLAIFSSELRKIPIKLGLRYASSSRQPSDTIYPTNASDTALVTFTTGSTGTPKAAKRTHDFLHEQFQALLEKIDPSPDDIDMPVLPIVLLINLGAGCTSVIADFKASKPDTLKPEKLLQQLVTHQVTRMVASPFVVKQLALYLSQHPYSLPALRKIFTGGAPVFPNEAALYIHAFPDVQIEIVYGSTEAEPISSVQAQELVQLQEEVKSSGLYVGIPYRKTAVAIIAIQTDPISCPTEQDFQKYLLPSEQIGEIIVSGSHVLQEYFNNAEALKQNKIFVGNQCWHRTGDSGYLQNGHLYLTGRCATLIYQNDLLICPFLYENYFQSIPGIEIGTIMSIDNQLFAILEPKKGISQESVEAYLQKAPTLFNAIRFVVRMPRDPRHHSKIDYAQLRKMLGDRKKAKND